jgi:hypothetical protein
LDCVIGRTSVAQSQCADSDVVHDYAAEALPKPQQRLQHLHRRIHNGSRRHFLVVLHFAVLTHVMDLIAMGFLDAFHAPLLGYDKAAFGCSGMD